MRLREVTKHVTARIAAAICCSVLCFLCGCGKNEQPKKVEAGAWAEEPSFKKAVEEHHVQAVEIGKRRAAVARRMEEMTAAMKEKLATEDEKKVFEELEKDAEWRELKQKADSIDAEFEEKRQKMLLHVRRQMEKGNFSN